MESENINVTLESTTPITVEQDDDCVEEISKFEAKQQGGRKKRKETSKVWEVFQTLDQKTPDGKPQAKCKYCAIVLKYDSKFGTAIAVKLDPRYKLQFVEYSYQTLYGENSEQFSKISASLYGLFNEYVAANASTSTSKSNTSSSASETQIEQLISARSSRLESSRKKFLKNYQSFESAKFGAMMDKSQLDLYLEEKLVKSTDVEELKELTEDIMKLSITKEKVASVQCSFAQD
ncbi:putative Zinc finger, BED-type [Corchorus olitorius]|uniref:Zinc finger, BED-type n=1 Tax=Corchorus olitorius TaxID=93759 RepID=A0A1R3HGB3_9ROSI|nr:putative Zinc finger, BED-type [Corchorus olitorius]